MSEYTAQEYTTRSKAEEDGVVGADKTIYNLEFNEDIKLTEGERYVMLYFQSTASILTRRVTSLVGMSNVFKAVKGSGKLVSWSIGGPVKRLLSFEAHHK